MMPEIIITTKQELALVIRQELSAFQERKQTQKLTKTYTINGVAKLLNRSHATIKKQVETGMLTTTKDGRISETEIEKYLGNDS
jgi:IS30 family transposase